MQQKKVTICASMDFWDDILFWKEKLEKNGYSVIQYPKQFTGEFLPNYKIEFTEHYQKITQSAIVLILNMKKNNVNGYIGASVFAEITFAIGLNRTSIFNKKIAVYFSRLLTIFKRTPILGRFRLVKILEIIGSDIE